MKAALLPRPVLLAVCAALLAGVVPASSAAAPRAFGDTRLFAQVAAPGYPDTTLELPDGTVVVSTNRGARGSVGPSKLFRLSRTGKLLRTYTVTGQVLTGDHGTMGLALDAQGRLYVADYSPPRVLRIDLKTGRQSTYATIPDLPSCTGPACDNGIGDSKPWPDGLAFDRTGRLLLTDLAQGTVFQVANGGGVARPWLQAPAFRSTFGVNQLQFDRDGSLVVSTTASLDGTTTSRGGLYRVPVGRDGRPGTPALLYATRPGEGPDGFALSRSGTIYLCTLVTNTVIAVTPNGVEKARLQRIGGALPFDSPSSATLRADGSLLVTNLTYFTSDAARAQVLDVFVGDLPVPAFRPKVR